MDFSNKDKLDYAQLVFRQVDRINMLMCQTNTGGYRTAANNNTFQAICALEALIYHRLNKNQQKKYEESKHKLHILPHSVESSYTSPRQNHMWFGVLMGYINESNLLPAQRTSYETGGDE